MGKFDDVIKDAFSGKGNLRSDIVERVKAIKGDKYKQNPKKLKSIPFKKTYKSKYSKQMLSYAKEAFEPIVNIVVNSVKKEVKTVNGVALIPPSIAVATEITNEIERYERPEVLVAVEVQVLTIGKDMLNDNNAQFAENMKNVFGFTPDFENDALYEHLDKWVEENVSLITKTTAEQKARLQSIVSENFRNGGRAKSMIDDINGVMKVNNSRLQLIARDQTAKLHGQITMRQQQSIGLTKYTWKTVGDERVRNRHAERNNKIYNWNDGINPGQEFQCRCTAEPIIDWNKL